MLGKDKTPKEDQILNEDGLDVRKDLIYDYRARTSAKPG